MLDRCFITAAKRGALLITLLMMASSAVAGEASMTQLSAPQAVWPWLATAMLLLLLMGFSLQASAQGSAANAEQGMLNATLGSSWVFLLFLLIGYGLTFGRNVWGLFGSDHFFHLDGANMQQVFYALLAAITLLTAGRALAGKVANSMQMTALLLMLPIYAVVCSWVWAGDGAGWLFVRGFSDVAGSSLVHSLAAWIGLAGFIALGLSSPSEADESQDDHRLLGVSLLLICLGWFGVSVGCAWFGGYATVSAASLVMNTMLGACGGMIGAALASYLLSQRLSLALVAIGAVAGLVSISAGVATMQSSFAIFTGLLGGVIAMFSMMLLRESRFAAIAPLLAAHGLSGVWGTLAAGMFYRGDFFNPDRMLIQSIGIIAIFITVFVTAWGVYYFTHKLFESGARS